MASRNYGLIIIGYGLISIGIMLLLLFFQTSGIFWLIFGVISLISAIWIIRKERTSRRTFFVSDDNNLE